MIANAFIFIAILIFAAGVLATGKLSQTVLFLSLSGFAMSVLFGSLGAWQAAIAELILGAIIIPYLFHRIMIRLPKEALEEKRDWVFPFQKKKDNPQLPVALKILPLAFLSFATLAWMFIPVFFKNLSSFLVKLQAPDPFISLVWETKKLDFIAVFIAALSCIFLIMAEKNKIKNDLNEQQKTDEPKEEELEQSKKKEKEELDSANSRKEETDISPKMHIETEQTAKQLCVKDKIEEISATGKEASEKNKTINSYKNKRKRQTWQKEKRGRK